jgi:hypothetical protein
MILIPNDMIGLGKTKVLLIFNSPMIRDREFTVQSLPKDRRNFTYPSTVHLKSLISKVNRIEKTSNAINYFAESLNHVVFQLEETVFLKPLLT